jgi:hypothetical protein
VVSLIRIIQAGQTINAGEVLIVKSEGKDHLEYSWYVKE